MNNSLILAPRVLQQIGLIKLENVEASSWLHYAQIALEICKTKDIIEKHISNLSDYSFHGIFASIFVAIYGLTSQYNYYINDNDYIMFRHNDFDDTIEIWWSGE